MGSFFKKIGEFFGAKPKPKTYVPMKREDILPPSDNLWAQKCRAFERLTNHSELAKLFVADSIPFGALPVYDLDGGEKAIITIEDGKPKYFKTDWTRITLQLQEEITEQNILECLLLAAKLAEPTDYVDEYARSGGWASVSGNKLENRLYNNIHVKDFPRTLLLPEASKLGVICQGSANGVTLGNGFFMVLEKIRVVRDA